MKKTLVLILTILLLALSFSYGCGPKKPETGKIKGIVMDSEGKPVAEATVTLEGEEGEENADVTLDDGSFLIEVSPGTYTLKIEKEGFETIERNVEIKAGEITTLLGPSGCGKTTLLRALAGFVEPFEGRIYLGDTDITIYPPQRRNTAMIFQNYALWPHMTVFQNVEYGLKLRKYPELEEQRKWYCKFLWITKPFFLFVPETYKRVYKALKEDRKEYLEESKNVVRIIKWYLTSWWKGIKFVFSMSKKTYLDFKAKHDPLFAYRRKKVLEVLKLVHLEDQIDKLPTQLSGGQQQRVAIARALANNPKIILADEPTGNLDTKSGEVVISILKDLNRKGLTIVIVTHDPDVTIIAHRVIHLKDGKIIKEEVRV